MRRQNRAQRLLHLLVVLGLLMGHIGQDGLTNPQPVRAAGASDIGYIYDDLGRLKAVVDPSGDAAIYTYDAVGNVLSISRQSASIVNIIEYTPGSGPEGQAVTIFGTGFSENSADNVVKFNGVDAIILASSPTQISTTVPAGATTGPITITTPTGTATSGEPFDVRDSQGPVISGFTPAMGPPGTAVTVVGANFETDVFHNVVAFNGARAQISSLSPTNLTADVPAPAASGRISVTTPFGTATSNGDFIVPPPGFSSSDIESTARIALGDTTTVQVSSAHKIAMLLFDGTQGGRISLRASNVTFSSSLRKFAVTIINPDGTVLVNRAIGSYLGLFVDTKTLPQTGTYTIVIDPNDAGTGSATFTLYDVQPDVTEVISPDGVPLTVTTTVPGQNALITFTGTAGQRISLNVTNSTMYRNYVSIRRPDGAWLASPVYMASNHFIDVKTLPMTGTYTILIDPDEANTGSITVRLHEVPPDVSETITADGTPLALVTTVPGQNVSLTFEATEGQRISIDIPSNSMGRYTYITIYNPDGSTLLNRDCICLRTFLDVRTLPATGTYTILIDPDAANTGSITLRLYDVPPDPTDVIAVGGPTTTVSMTVPGQNARLTFDGEQGQQLRLLIPSNSMGLYVYVSIYNPDGSTLVGRTCTCSQTSLSVKPLPTTGTYTILVDPDGNRTGSITLGLIDVLVGQALPPAAAEAGSLDQITAHIRTLRSSIVPF